MRIDLFRKVAATLLNQNSVGAYAAMPAEEKQALVDWERQYLNGTTSTSDWPGWEKYIGKKPIFPEPPHKLDKQPIPAELRWHVWERDNFTCVQCGARRDLTVDHIIPESRGGTMELANLQTLCRSCNSKKGTHILDDAG